MATVADSSPPRAPGTAGAPGLDRGRRDPLAPVMALGRREMRIGIVIGLLGALLVHGVLAARGLMALIDLQQFANLIQDDVVERYRSTINIDVKTPPPAPEPTAPPPEPTAPAPLPTNAPPPPKDAPEPAPAAAQAGKILTAPPDPNEPLDLTDKGFVTGNGDRYAGGTTVSSGTSQTAVHSPYARAGGTPGATGKAPVQAPPPPAKDLSAPARPNATNWSCGFPAEADMDQIDYAVVRVVVTVTAEGRARSVSVLNDPGHGFGRLARQCAFRQTYTPGRDRYGKAVSRTTPPITVRFTR